ncbi:MAG: extracellular solute-binding protein [Deinococcota bacterium]
MLTRFRWLLVGLSLLGLSSAMAQELELWTFVNTHARWFREQAERYKAEVNPDFDLNVVEIAYDDMHDRLRISLQSGGVGAPDLSDVEQGAFGSFLRGGGDPGFVPLNDLLESGGYSEQLVSARQALYTYDGTIYGVEHALTPVVLYYRADVWEGAGVDPQSFETWDDFIEGARVVKEQNPDVIPLPVYRVLPELLLRQRGEDYFDAEGNVTIDSELSIDTVNWVLNLMDEGLAAQMPDDNNVNGSTNWPAFKDSTFVSMVGADWFAGSFKDNVPELAGKWKAAPLPAWEEGGIHTSVWGGTGLTVINTSPNAAEAQKFLEFAMLSEEGNVRRFELTSLFPPFIPAMSNERLRVPDDYFSDQDLGAVFAEVGPSAPAQYQSPFRTQLNDLAEAAWQDIMDGNRTPEDIFGEIANTIRDEMSF